MFKKALLSITLFTSLCIANSREPDTVYTDEKGNQYSDFNRQHGGYTDKDGNYHLSNDEMNSGYFSYDENGILIEQ